MGRENGVQQEMEKMGTLARRTSGQWKAQPHLGGARARRDRIRHEDAVA